MYRLGGGDHSITITQLGVQASTRSSLHLPPNFFIFFYFFFSETAVVLNLDIFQSNANRLKSIDLKFISQFDLSFSACQPPLFHCT